MLRHAQLHSTVICRCCRRCRGTQRLEAHRRHRLLAIHLGIGTTHHEARGEGCCQKLTLYGVSRHLDHGAQELNQGDEGVAVGGCEHTLWRIYARGCLLWVVITHYRQHPYYAIITPRLLDVVQRHLPHTLYGRLVEVCRGKAICPLGTTLTHHDVVCPLALYHLHTM